MTSTGSRKRKTHGTLGNASRICEGMQHDEGERHTRTGISLVKDKHDQIFQKKSKMKSILQTLSALFLTLGKERCCGEGRGGFHEASTDYTITGSYCA